MARRFSGDVRLTISKGTNEATWLVRLKAPGCGVFDGSIILEHDFCDLHSESEEPLVIDEVARRFLQFCEEYGEKNGRGELVGTAAKTKKGWHVSDEMAYRFPGERTDRRTK